MDVRHPFKEFDQMMLKWADDAGAPIHLLLTKADKLSRGAAAGTLSKVRHQLPPAASAQLFSATTRIGREDLENLLRDWLDVRACLQGPPE